MKTTLTLFALCLFSLITTGKLLAQDSDSIAPDVFVRVDPQGHMASVKSVMFSPDGTLLYSVSDDKTVRVWDIENEVLVNTFRGYQESNKVGMLNSGAMDPEGDAIAVAGFLGVGEIGNGDIRYINAYTGEIFYVFEGHDSPVVALEFANDRSYLVSGSVDGTIGIWDLSSGEGVRFQAHSAEVYGVSFSPDAKQLLTCSYDGTAVLWDFEALTAGEVSYQMLNDHEDAVRTCDYSPTGKYFATAGYDNRVLLYNNDGEFVKEVVEIVDENYPEIGGFGDIHSISFSEDGKRLVVCTGVFNNESNTRVYEIPSGKLLTTFNKHDNTVICSDFYGDELIATAGGNNRDIYVWNAKTGEEVAHFAGKGDRVWKVAAGPDNLIGIGTVKNEVQHTNDFGQLNKVFDLAKVSYEGYQDDFSEFTSEQEYYENYQIGVIDGYTLGITDGVEMNYIELEPGYHGAINCYSFTPNGEIVLGTNYRLMFYDIEGNELREGLGHEADVYSLAFSEDGRYMYTGAGDQTVRIWDLSDKGELEMTPEEFLADLYWQYGEDQINGLIEEKGQVWLDDLYNTFVTNQVFPVASLFISNDDEWICWNKDNYYTTSHLGSQMVGFHVNSTWDSKASFYAFEQFDVRLNRPDLVLNSLGTGIKLMEDMYYKAYLKRLERLGVTLDQLEDNLAAPEIEMFTVSQVVTSSYFGLNFNMTDFENSIDRMYVSINDVPVYGPKGFSTGMEGSTGMIVYTMHEELVPGNNKIQAWCTNELGIRSNVETINVFFDTVNVVPNLYFLGIGASQYADSDYNLSYAAKDVRDFIDLYADNENYNKVIVDTLFDTDVTLKNIEAAFERLDEAHPYDHVIIYYAGHGVLNKDMDYFLATHDINFDSPEKKGLSYEYLESEVGNLVARTRTVFIDACHSGELDKSDMELAEAVTTTDNDITFRTVGATVKTKSGAGFHNSFELMQNLFTDLRGSSGATVISSAGGGEYALEGGEWQNGVFTYSILNGLSSGDADLNGDGAVMLTELQYYVRAEVEELTDGQQKPTSRLENVSNDYRFW